MKKKDDYMDADFILYNGKIWIGKNRKDESAVAIKKNYIVYVGDDTTVQNYSRPHTKLLNLQGKRVIPGFNDAHAHLLSTSGKLFGNIEEYNKASKTSTNEIASVIYRILLIFYGQFYHRMCKFFNTTPMDLKTSGVPLPSLTKILMKRSWARMMHQMAEMGVTSITESGIRTWREFNALCELYKSGDFPIRVNLLIASRLMDDAIERGYKTGWGDEWLRVSGVKLYADGWLSPRTAALNEPYEKSQNKGILFLNPKKAYYLVEKAYTNGLRVSTHAIGDKAVKTILNAYKTVLEQECEKMGKKPNELDHRFSIEHATLVPEEENCKLQSLMSELKVTASIQFNFAATSCNSIINTIGILRSKYWNVYNSFITMNIPCAGGSDYPITDVHPLSGIQRVITRADVDGDPVGCNPYQIVTIEDALDMITRGGAYHSFEENIKGSIEVGKLADIVVLSNDIIEMAGNEQYRKYIHKVEVELTVIDGKIEYLNPKSSLYPFSSTIKSNLISNNYHSKFTTIHGLN